MKTLQEKVKGVRAKDHYWMNKIREIFGDNINSLTFDDLKKYPELSSAIGNALDDFIDDIVDDAEGLWHSEDMRLFLEQLFPGEIQSAREHPKPWHNTTLEESQRISYLMSKGMSGEQAMHTVFEERKKKTVIVW
ncbi:MAG: hypothetical protein PVF58_14250 [Candidatus Methanofastidiosia archaeon]|jgi:hypothetical protein